MVPLSFPHWALFLSVLATVCVFDLLKRRAPNWLTVGLLAAGLGARGVEAGLGAAGMGLLGALTGLAVLFVPFYKGWMPGGDVKMLTAVGGWFGPVAILHTILAGGVAGGVLALIDLLRAPDERRRQMLLNLRLAFFLRQVPEVEPRQKYDKLPYSLAWAAGAVAILVYHRGAFGLA